MDNRLEHYKQKYLKYKSKYLLLRSEYSDSQANKSTTVDLLAYKLKYLMAGGMQPNDEDEDEENENPLDKEQQARRRDVYNKNVKYVVPHITKTHPIEPVFICDSSFVASARQINIQRRNPQVIIAPMDTDTAIVQYSYAPNTVAVLVFANGKRAGGGYNNGADAQEEELCRQYPMLYASLTHYQRPRTNAPLYPIGENEVFVVKNITRSRNNATHNYETLTPPNMVHTVHFIVADAPNLGRKPTFLHNSDSGVTRAFIETKLDLTMISPLFDWQKQFHPEHPRTLILGAWGCGAFAPHGKEHYAERVKYKNNIAREMFRKVREFGYFYDQIIFAIPPSHHRRDDDNLTIFNNVFRLYNSGDPLNYI